MPEEKIPSTAEALRQLLHEVLRVDFGKSSVKKWKKAIADAKAALAQGELDV